MVGHRTFNAMASAGHAKQTGVRPDYWRVPVCAGSQPDNIPGCITGLMKQSPAEQLEDMQATLVRAIALLENPKIVEARRIVEANRLLFLLRGMIDGRGAKRRVATVTPRRAVTCYRGRCYRSSGLLRPCCRKYTLGGQGPAGAPINREHSNRERRPRCGLGARQAPGRESRRTDMIKAPAQPLTLV